MNINKFKHDDWVKIWEGKWSLLTCADFGQQYTGQIKFGSNYFQSQSIIFAANGRSAGWMRQKDRDIAGNYLSKQVVRNPKIVDKISNNLKSEAKSLLKFIDEHENTVCTWELYEEFWQRILIYYHPHINVKYVVDYLDPNLLKKHLPKFESARLAAEDVFNRTEDFMIGFAKLLSKKTKYDYKLLLCLTKNELKQYYTTNKLPNKTELQKRYKRSVLLFEKGKNLLIVGKDVSKVETIVHPKINKSMVKGSTAYPGYARGIARIIGDPHKVKVFNKGDILITGMTRPDFIPLMHKAAAFVTDAGGILSHAAITAREMKKPCVIGTLVATKVFKDGDMVEVDANRGVVTILKS